VRAAGAVEPVAGFDRSRAIDRRHPRGRPVRSTPSPGSAWVAVRRVSTRRRFPVPWNRARG